MSGKATSLSFVARHRLWSEEQNEAAVRLRRTVEEKGLDTIRLSFPDQHGILRGKTLVASEALRILENGCTITTTMLAKASIELNQDAGTAPNGVPRLTWSLMNKMPMFQIIG